MSLLGYSTPETLTDDAGNALKGITVTVTGPSAYSGSAVTDSTSGVLRLGPLPVGDYTVTLGSRSVTVPVLAGLPAGGADGQVVSQTAGVPAWSTPTGGGGTAATTTFTPTGSIAATNVQAAVAEVATEYVAADTAAVATAASDATSKANAAQAAAIAAAATDATTKANAAQTAATSAASTDATSKVGTETTRATTAEALKAPLASPTFTGVPAAPTAAPGTSTTQLATTAFVAAQSATSVAVSTFDAAGDLLVGTGNDVYAKLPKGSALQGLRVNAAGTALEYADPVAGALTPTTTKTAPYTVAVGEIAMMNVPGGAVTLTLPTAPADKAQVGYRAIGATTAVPLAIACGGSDTIGTAGATTASIPLSDEVAVLQYQASSTRWLAVSNVKTQASQDARYVPRSLFDANTVLAATVDDTPTALTVPASTILGRKATGGIAALSPTEAANVIGLRNTILEGQQVWCYGHSYMTTGKNWVSRLQNRIGFSNVFNQGTGGDFMIDVARRIGTGFTSSSGLMIIEGTTNDAQQPSTAKVTAGFTNGLIAAIHLARSGATKTENTSANVVYTGTWTQNTDADFSGGSNRSTVTQNDYFTAYVSGDRFQIVVAAIDDTNYGTAGASFTVTVDGAAYGGTYTTSNQMTRTTVAGKSRGPMVVDVTGRGPGYHTVVVTKTDASGSILFFDCICTAPLYPMQVVIVKDYAIANAAQSVIDGFNTIIDTVVASFASPRVFAIDGGVGHDTLTMDSGDRIHPNGRGSENILLNVTAGLNAVTNGPGLDDVSYAESFGPTPAVVTSGADNFTRADNPSSLGVTSTGAVPWQVETAKQTFGIISNKLYISNSTTLHAAATVDTGRSDLTLNMTIGTPSAGLRFRGSSDINYYVWFQDGSLYWANNTGPTLLVAGTGSFVANDVLQVILSGSSIICKKNGTTTISTTHTGSLTGTRHGPHIFNSAAGRVSAFSWS